MRVILVSQESALVKLWRSLDGAQSRQRRPIQERRNPPATSVARAVAIAPTSHLLAAARQTAEKQKTDLAVGFATGSAKPKRTKYRLRVTAPASIAPNAIVKSRNMLTQGEVPVNLT